MTLFRSYQYPGLQRGNVVVGPRNIFVMKTEVGTDLCLESVYLEDEQVRCRAEILGACGDCIALHLC